MTRRGTPQSDGDGCSERLTHAAEETAEILSDKGTLDALRAGLDELAHDETVELDQARRELAALRETQDISSR